MSDTTQSELLSIGDVAKQSGISADTIRVWERRYGRPVPVRLPSGHRRYTPDQVRWLRRVAEALALGRRPGKVVRMDEPELGQLLDHERTEPGEPETVERLLRLVVDFEKAEIETLLHDRAERLGTREFLSEIVTPLVDAVGRHWVDGSLEVRHEHFLSSLLEDLLRTLRMRIPETEGSPVVLLATLPGELHGIGLQMAALAVALAGARPRVLGVDSPVDEIAAAAAECEAGTVAISVSLATGGVGTDRVLGELRAVLPDGILLVVGGRGARGARRGPRGVDYVADLAEFERYVDAL